MERESRTIKHGGVKRFDFTGAAAGGSPEERRGPLADASHRLFRPSGDAMTDQQSFRCMEERYGIREEGIF